MIFRDWKKLLVFAGLVYLWTVEVSSARELALQEVSLSLPGVPSLVLPADVDQDGRLDLVVVVAYTEWDQIDIQEVSEMQGVEGLVEILTVIPALTDRRELWVFRSKETGGYEPLADALPLDLSVLSMAATEDGARVLALTDRGASVLRLRKEESGPSLELVPWVDRPPVLAGSGTFLPNLELLHDLNGDGTEDLLLPTGDGLAVVLGPVGEAPPVLASLSKLPGEENRVDGEVVLHYPMPVLRKVDGDGLPDLLVPDLNRHWRRFHVLRSGGRGRFSLPVEPPTDPEMEGHPIAYFGDLDGDDLAEYVTEEDLSDDDAGMRKEVREAKRPPVRYRLHRARKDLAMEEKPYEQFDAIGYSFEEGDDSEFQLPAGFQDLDGDGRQDLISITLEFSLLKALSILATQRISIGLDFHVWCQDESGAFEAVDDLDLSGRFRLNLKNLRVSQLSQFAGDFDGDGRTDFVQIGRGRKVTIHRGGEGCRFPAEPDLLIRLTEEPQDLSLVQVRDLDGDGRADLMVTQPEGRREMGVTPRARLDLYLSGVGQ
jgi:hypothetical protein